MLGTAAIAEVVTHESSESSHAALSPGITAGKADVSQIQPLRNRSSADHNMDKPLIRTPAKAHKPKVGVPALYFSGKTRNLQTRSTTPDINIAARNTRIPKPDPLIGPVQESRKPGMPEDQTASQADGSTYSPFEFPSVFGDHPFVAKSLLMTLLNDPHRPGNESLRLDQVTHEALHGGN